MNKFPAICYCSLTHLPLDKMAAILADDNFKGIFLNFLKFVPKSPIDNRPSLVLVMAWRWTGDKSLRQLMLTQFTDAYMRH